MARFMAATGLALALVAPPVSAAGPFDGTYAGSQHITTNGNTGACARAERPDIRLRVANNRFSYTWLQQLDVPVGPDGAIHFVQDVDYNRSVYHVVITGRIADGMLVADAGSSSCAVHLALRKQ